MGAAIIGFKEAAAGIRQRKDDMDYAITFWAPPDVDDIAAYRSTIDGQEIVYTHMTVGQRPGFGFPDDLEPVRVISTADPNSQLAADIYSHWANAEAPTTFAQIVGTAPMSETPPEDQPPSGSPIRQGPPHLKRIK